MIIALMFYGGDLEATASLARLLADIEPRRRTDVVLSFVSQPDTADSILLDRTIRHCSRRFFVEKVRSELGGTGGDACCALWTGTCSHYFNRWKKRTIDHDCILTLDGGDGVPLHRNWIDLFKLEHRRTLEGGKLITGSPYFLNTCPLHVNPQAIFDFRVFELTKMLTDVPKYEGKFHFDVYHRNDMLQHSSLSSIARTDWHGEREVLKLDAMLDRSTESAWLHGFKDSNMRSLAREHLSRPLLPPNVKHYNVEQLKTHESVRRDHEKFWSWK
jgi:hypothetical protein